MGKEITMKQLATAIILVLLALALGAETICPETGEIIPDHVSRDGSYRLEPAPVIDRDVDAWSGTGPWGGNVRSIITDPNDPTRVMAACGLNLATTVGGVYSSTDGGQHWQPTSLQGKPYYALAASASQAGTWWAGARNGLYKSVDHGATWNPAGLSTTYILALGVQANNGNVVVAGKSGNVGIVVSQDGGNNFAAVGVNSGFMRQFTYSASNPQRMYIVMGSSSASVLTSIDNGSTWTPYGPTGDGWGMYVSPTDSLFALVAHADGIFRTTDGGANWSNVAGGTFRSVVEYNGNFYATSNSSGVKVSTNMGQTWQAHNPGVVQSTWQAAASTASGALLGHWGGIFRATGPTEAIIPFHTGINSAFVHGLAYYSDTSELWAGTEGSGIFRSLDNGATWENMVNGLNNWMVYELVPTNHLYYHSGRMLAGTLDGVYTSIDGGNTWSYVHYQGLQVSALEVHPTDPDKFWIGTSTGEIKYTQDGGASWTTCTGGMFGFAPRLKLGKGPMGNLRLFLCYQGSATAVWYSDDGINFTASTGMDGTTYQPMVAVRPGLGTQSQIVYASSNSGIYRSLDNGATFSLSGMGGFSWSVLSGPGMQVLSGKDNGISYSVDEAQTATSLNQNLNNPTIWQMAWGSSTNQVFIASRGLGVMENRFDATDYAPPQNVQVQQGNASATLSWTEPTGTPAPMMYMIWRDGFPRSLATQPQYTDTGLTNGQQYHYWVSAVYDGNIHTCPQQILTVTPVLDPILPPTGLEAVVLGNLPTLRWINPARVITGYKVKRDGVLIHTITDPASTTFADGSLPVGQYLYSVSATYTTGESDPANITVMIEWNSFRDDFESHESFAIQFAPWTLLDVDQSDTYSIVGTLFPHAGEDFAFMVFAPSETAPPVMDAAPHSGSKQLACFASVDAPNNDWLISPLLTFNSPNYQSFHFWARSYTSIYGLERIRVGVSSGGTDPGDFTILSGPSYVEVPTTWTQYIYQTPGPSIQKRIGIQCVSDDAFILFVDDFLQDVATANSDNVSPGARSELIGNYPNPFNPSTTIRYRLDGPTELTLRVYNLKGQLVRELVSGSRTAGDYSIVWDGTDSQGRQVASGVYHLRMKVGGIEHVKSMIMIK
jgi:hypothetical protein